MIIRNGRRVRQHIYLQLGDEPSDTDPPVGYIHDPLLAENMVYTLMRYADAVAGELMDAADDIEERVDWSSGRSNYGDNDGYLRSAQMLRHRAEAIRTNPQPLKGQ